MLSTARIERLIALEAYGRLVRSILQNGRGGGQPLACRLTRPGTITPAALGLALQRHCELTYEPHRVAAGIAERLRGLQREDGLYGPGPAGCLAATAVAVRGLADWIQLHQLAVKGPLPPGALAAHRTIDRAVSAMGRLQDDDGALGADPLDAAIVIWQLGQLPAFRQAVRCDELLHWIDRASRSSLPPDLDRFAHAAAA